MNPEEMTQRDVPIIGESPEQRIIRRGCALGEQVCKALERKNYGEERVPVLCAALGYLTGFLDFTGNLKPNNQAWIRRIHEITYAALRKGRATTEVPSVAEEEAHPVDPT